MPSFRVELHSHCQGDPVDTYLKHTIYQQIDRAKEVGLDVLAITWHRRICDNPAATAYAREKGILLLNGMEADMEERQHLVILNLAKGDLPPTPDWDQVRALRARKPEVFIFAPHPFYPHPTCLGNKLDQYVDCIDAVEWCGLHVDWIPSRVNPNLRAERWARRHGKPIIACSDAHTLKAVGKNASSVEADELTPAAIFDGIKAGQVNFSRASLHMGSLLYQSAKAMSSQPRHIGRWVKAKVIGKNRGTLPDAHELEA